MTEESSKIDPHLFKCFFNSPFVARGRFTSKNPFTYSLQDQIITTQLRSCLSNTQKPFCTILNNYSYLLNVNYLIDYISMFPSLKIRVVVVVAVVSFIIKIIKWHYKSYKNYIVPDKELFTYLYITLKCNKIAI